jgi:hypothetical protein
MGRFESLSFSVKVMATLLFLFPTLGKKFQMTFVDSMPLPSFVLLLMVPFLSFAWKVYHIKQ